MFGDHVVPMHDYTVYNSITSFGKWLPSHACVSGLTYPDADAGTITSCNLQCSNGFTPSLPGHTEQQGNTPIFIFCNIAESSYVYGTPIGQTIPDWGADAGDDDDTFPAAEIICNPNACISTSDEALANANTDTHILCENELIASGKTGACKCSGEEPTTQATQATTTQTTTTSSASAVYKGKLYVVALSTLSTLSFLV
jgi:hypothetical protein